jgi:catalase
MEFIRDQYRHCKPILALGASRSLLQKAGIPLDGADSALIVGQQPAAGTQAFIKALGSPRDFRRETDPPRV